jgi:hypothetical protein
MPLVPDGPGTGVTSRAPESDDAERLRVNPAGVRTSALSPVPVNGTRLRPETGELDPVPVDGTRLRPETGELDPVPVDGTR